MGKMGIGWLTPEYCQRQQSSDGGISTVEEIQWLKKMSQCLHDLERSAWCNLLT